MKTTHGVIVVLSWLMSIIATQTAAQALPDFPFVTVEVTSERQVQPNQASLSFQLLTFDKQADVASELLHMSVTTMLEQLTRLGIKSEQITSFEISKRAKRKRDDDYNSLDILGYEVRQAFKLELSELSQYSDIVNILYKAEHVQDIESRFDHSEREQISAELVFDAGKKAKQKAQRLAKGLGVDIESVFAINDSGSFNNALASFAVADRYVQYGSFARKAAPITVFEPQFIEISKTIHVIYKLAI
ncbi:DUF541 domain-containing protein [Thalassotalea sp. HSM 43]|uniref:SIMPL domain-containing protein n=1 Tax=Thalassotalea sp. HSM 43 TaxID=2552945 RepID=UPI0010821A8A|nr:SIMPL domain-containing protein [Thalassotalea sp. HSM 43]QBY03074.1 DUF541 domain-containing protein [Thalassotalea sp. HSM 43]